MFEGGGYDERVDLWALGVTIYQLMSGYTPFQSEYHSDTINNIMKGEVVFDAPTEEKYSKMAKNFVLRLIRKKSERLSAKEGKKDMWFLDIEDKDQRVLTHS